MSGLAIKKVEEATMQSNRFHLAITVLDIQEAKKFYCGLLGCTPGNFEKDKWQDINFWGNELTLHKSSNIALRERHDVDMGHVAVPHYGAHLEEEEFQALKEKIKKSSAEFLDPPYRRFKGDPREQETFFIEDPSGNILEIKTMAQPKTLFQN
jgi:hypothetical protein